MLILKYGIGGSLTCDEPINTKTILPTKTVYNIITEELRKRP
jgi:hypothetical protein